MQQHGKRKVKHVTSRSQRHYNRDPNHSHDQREATPRILGAGFYSMGILELKSSTQILLDLKQ